MTLSIGSRIYAAAFCVCDCGTQRVIRVDQLKAAKANLAAALDEMRPALTVQLTGAVKVEFTAFGAACAPLHQPLEAKLCRLWRPRIKVCPQWNDFECFKRDVGDPPSPKHTLDRIEVNGIMSRATFAGNTRRAKLNCRATIYVNLNGENVCLREACRRVGIKYPTVQGRMSRVGS